MRSLECGSVYEYTTTTTTTTTTPRPSTAKIPSIVDTSPPHNNAPPHHPPPPPPPPRPPPHPRRRRGDNRIHPNKHLHAQDPARGHRASTLSRHPGQRREQVRCELRSGTAVGV